VAAAQAHIAPHARRNPLSVRKEVATQLVAGIKGGGMAALVDLVACRVGAIHMSFNMGDWAGGIKHQLYTISIHVGYGGGHLGVATLRRHRSSGGPGGMQGGSLE
jgi:hypothetical protein